MVPFFTTDSVWNSFLLPQHTVSIDISIVNSDCATHNAEVFGLESGPRFRLELLEKT